MGEFTYQSNIRNQFPLPNLQLLIHFLPIIRHRKHGIGSFERLLQRLFRVQVPLNYVSIPLEIPISSISPLKWLALFFIDKRIANRGIILIKKTKLDTNLNTFHPPIYQSFRIGLRRISRDASYFEFLRCTRVLENRINH